MKRRRVKTTVVGCVLIVLSGCGLQSSGVEEGPSAPTGVAPGTTLYFLDDDGELVAQQRKAGRLGTVSEAVSLLLTGPGDSAVNTGIASTAVTRTEVTVSGERMSLRVPVSSEEVSADGVDQIVCTALTSHIQAGGAETTRVRLRFTDHTETEWHTCPVFG